MAGSAPTPDAPSSRRPEHALARAPWTVPVAALLLVVEAIVIAEHARRLLTGVVLAEETLGLASLGPLDREVPAAVLEAFAAIGLVIAAISIARRSRLALGYGGAIQLIVVFEIALRIIGGLALPPTLALAVLVLATGATLAASRTRRWTDEPILLGH